MTVLFSRGTTSTGVSGTSVVYTAGPLYGFFNTYTSFKELKCLHVKFYKVGFTSSWKTSWNRVKFSERFILQLKYFHYHWFTNSLVWCKVSSFRLTRLLFTFENESCRLRPMSSDTQVSLAS